MSVSIGDAVQIGHSVTVGRYRHYEFKDPLLGFVMSAQPHIGYYRVAVFNEVGIPRIVTCWTPQLRKAPEQPFEDPAYLERLARIDAHDEDLREGDRVFWRWDDRIPHRTEDHWVLEPGGRRASIMGITHVFKAQSGHVDSFAIENPDGSGYRHIAHMNCRLAR